MNSHVDWSKTPYNPKLDKADAVLRYLEHYDYEHLKTLMLPKEDAPFLMEVLNWYIDNMQIKGRVNTTTHELLNVINEIHPENGIRKNTEITYFYYEPDTNNKTWFSHVLKGEYTNEQYREIFDSMAYDKCDFFYPELVNLPNNDIVGKHFDFFEMKPTRKEPTLNMTMEELVTNFKKAYENNWELEHEELDK